MKKKVIRCLLSAMLVVLLAINAAGCGGKGYRFEKPAGDDDFQQDSNLISADYTVDGVLDEPIWSSGETIDIVFGQNASVDVKIVWGERGITFGYEIVDRYLATSRNFNDELYVINSDNIELFIDTKLDGGAKCQPDDYQFNINPDGYAMLQVGGGTSWGPWSGVIDYAVTAHGTVNNDSDLDEGWTVEIFLPYSSFGLTRDSTVGIAFGSRVKTTNLTTSDWYGWSMVPDPQVPDNYIPMSKDGFSIPGTEGYVTKNGGFEKRDDKIVSTRAASIALKEGASVTEGTVSASMKAGVPGDNGIVFNVTYNNLSTFYEDGASYYFYFINKDGNAFLGKVADKPNSTDRWTTIQVSPIANYDANREYALKVVLSDGYIYGFIDGELKITYLDPSPLTGTACGFRAQNANVAYSEMTVTSDVSDVPGKVDGFKIASGAYRSAEQGLVSDSANAMAISTELSLAGGNGTVAAKLKAASRGDNGIVFGLDDNGAASYWEEKDYYFFFINLDGRAYLAKLTGETDRWHELLSVPVPGYNVADTYTLQAAKDGGKLRCWVNGALLISVTDASPLTGTQVGVRASVTGVTFTELTAAVEIPPYVTDPDGYKVVNGVFEETTGGVKLTSAAGLAVRKNLSFTDGTFAATVKSGAKGDNGIVFGLNDGGADSYWEEKDYYFFFTNEVGLAYLAKLQGTNRWNELKSVPIPGYDVANAYELKVVREGAKIRCYVDDVLFINVTDADPVTGTQVGVRGNRAETAFTGMTVSTELPPDVHPVGFQVKTGAFAASGAGISNSSATGLAVSTNRSLARGTFSAQMKSSSAGDSGIVFGLDDGGADSYWEEKDYYFFFINMHGDAYLAKVKSGWNELQVTRVFGYNVANTYTLSVALDNGRIRCYVDGVQYIDYTDAAPLAGTQVGVRAGVSGVLFTALTATSDVPAYMTAPEGYKTVNGEYKVDAAGSMVATHCDAFAVSETLAMTGGDGTVSAVITAGKFASDNGLVFGLDDGGASSYWETDKSYYFLFINVNGDLLLAKITNGAWSTVSDGIADKKTKIDNYNKDTAYTVKAVKTGGAIACYVNDELFYTYEDAMPLSGTQVGIRAQAPGVSFGSLTVA